MQIKTNGHRRELRTVWELPAGVADEWFDYAKADSDDGDVPRFFLYRGAWYDAHEFERASGEIADRGWHAWQTESYFSAVVVKFLDDGFVAVGYSHW